MNEVDLDTQDIVYQLRKRAEIRAKIDRGDGKIDRISVQLLRAADEVERLRAALRFYADPDIYEPVMHMDPVPVIEIDVGKIARAALDNAKPD